MKKMQFPEVEGINLEGTKYRLPYDLEGDLNLVVIPFKQYQQFLVDQWAASTEPIFKKSFKVNFYELPTLSRRYRPVRFFIDGGMRAGIPDVNIRRRTITLYIDKNRVKKPLEISDENNIYIFLINPLGQIFWHSNGEVNKGKIEALENCIKRYISNNEKIGDTA